jgi:hypothetical protein
MELATKLIVEFSDSDRPAIAGRLSRAIDLHEVSDLIMRKVGKRPAFLTIVRGLAYAKVSLRYHSVGW